MVKVRLNLEEIQYLKQLVNQDSLRLVPNSERNRYLISINDNLYRRLEVAENREQNEGTIQ